MSVPRLESKLELIKRHIGTFQDFPKQGIVFKDLFTALANREVCTAVRDLLLDYLKQECPDVDAVVGLDARGFLFGFTIAADLGIGFVPIRKKGKLPGPCYTYEYKLEYGSDTVQMQTTGIKAGQKVIILDDLLATGGTLQAACNLIEQAQGIVEKIIVIMELKSLNGRSKIDGKNVHSFIEYE